MVAVKLLHVYQHQNIETSFSTKKFYDNAHNAFCYNGENGCVNG